MSRITDNMEHLLVALGKAHQHGAFAGASARFPWQAAAPVAVRTVNGQRSRWIWVGAPLTAAAAVAAAFVGTFLFPTQTSRLNEMVATSMQPGQPELADAAVAICKGDYNGDGLVDGRDIPAFMERLQSSELTVDEQNQLKNEMTRCLLESSR